MSPVPEPPPPGEPFSDVERPGAAGDAPEESVLAIQAPPPPRDNPLTRSAAGVAGMAFLAAMILACILTLPWTLGSAPGGEPRYNAGQNAAGRLPPVWWPKSEEEILRLNALVPSDRASAIAADHSLSTEDVRLVTQGPPLEDLKDHWPITVLGTDILGRSLAIRILTGGGISLTIGIAAALISVFIGTIYGTIAGYAGGRTDAVMMRVVDILFGLPYILLVVLLAVAVDGWVDRQLEKAVEQASALRQIYVEDQIADRWPEAEERTEALVAQSIQQLGDDPELQDERDQWVEAQAAELGVAPTEEQRARLSAEAATVHKVKLDIDPKAVNVITLLVAIGGVSWLTMARVIRGQVLSLKSRPFMEAARATGVPLRRQFLLHLLPNLLGPIVVYATLTVPQAILQESFLSFLGIGVQPPLPSWGNLAAEGLSELNQHKSHWWLLFFPCLLLGLTLLSLNFVGEGLREAFDPRRAKR